jgi:predicted  nucleic acid-binding Zn-ribbon protein
MNDPQTTLNQVQAEINATNEMITKSQIEFNASVMKLVELGRRDIQELLDKIARLELMVMQQQELREWHKSQFPHLYEGEENNGPSIVA